MNKEDYVKFETEICYTKEGSYSVTRTLIDKGKLSEKFLDDLWNNDSIDDMLLGQNKNGTDKKALGCPFCKGNNIEYFLGFRYCRDCKKEYNYSDFEDAGSNNAFRIAFLEEELKAAREEAEK